MTPRERVEAAVQGERPDRVPIALWRHFPRDDQTAEGLARATVEFQRAYRWDLVKVTPASGYPAEAWGARLEPADNPEGTRTYLQRPVRRPDDWAALPELDPDANPVLSRELRALALVREALRRDGDDAPVLQTVFSPLTIAKQLSGELLQEHLEAHPDAVRGALETIARTTARFARRCVEAGADGIFFATQLASHDALSLERYEAFGLPFDLRVLGAIRERGAWPVVLHLHGTRPMFELIEHYAPYVHVVNWHDRETPPSLDEAQALFQGAVLGGLHRSRTLPHGSPEAVRREVLDAVERTRGRRLIVGAGCVAPVTTPPENFRAAREAVERAARPFP